MIVLLPHLTSLALAQQGFLWPAVDLAGGELYADVIGLGDLDGDGVDELVVGGPDLAAYESVTSRPTVLASMGSSSDLSLADLDGDGRPDVVGRYTGWYRNDGSGGFDPPIPLEAYLPGDVDGDGDLDLFQNIGGYTVSENLGSGVFAPARPTPGPSGGTLEIVADLNGDRLADLVVDNVPSPSVQWRERELGRAGAAALTHRLRQAPFAVTPTSTVNAT